MNIGIATLATFILALFLALIGGYISCFFTSKSKKRLEILF